MTADVTGQIPLFPSPRGALARTLLGLCAFSGCEVEPSFMSLAYSDVGGPEVHYLFCARHWAMWQAQP